MTVGRFARGAGATGWALLAPILVLAPYLALALVITRLVDDPIAATVVVSVVVFALVLILRRRSPCLVRIQPDAEGVPRSFWIQVALAALLAFAAGQAASMIVYALAGSPGFDATGRARAGAGVIAVVLTLAVAPVAEELLFRGLLYPLLRRGLAVVPAVLVQAVSFAVIHGNIVQATTTLPLAILLAVVYERTRRLVPVVLVHTGFNLLATVIPAAVIAPLSQPFSALTLMTASLLGSLVLLRTPKDRVGGAFGED